MARKGFTLEQGIAFFGFLVLVSAVVLFFVYYPAFQQLNNRSERLPKVTDEVYGIALNAKNKMYKPLDSKGRDIFMPLLSIYIRPSRRMWTRSPSQLPPTSPSVIPSKSPTTPPPPSRLPVQPFVLPVSLVGIYRPDESSPRMVILQLKATGEYHTLKEGDVISGMKVIEISAIFVKLQGPAPSEKVYTLKDPRALEFE